MNTQTSVMIKKSNEAEDEPTALQWKWTPEIIDPAVVTGSGQVSADFLVDQKVSNDTSDYMWYMTRYEYRHFLII